MKNPQTYVQRTLRMSAAGQLINAVESLYSIKKYRSDGIMRGRATGNQTSFLPLPVRKFLDSTSGATVIHVANAAAPALTLLGGRRCKIAAAALSLLVNKSFETRNPYGRDGSDQLQGVINGYRVATALIPDADLSDELFLRALNAQLCVSYLASGLAKLISSDWRSGRAMELIMRTKTYGNTPFASFIISHPDVGRLISWATIAGEVCYPIVYVTDPRIARHGLTLAKLFHLVIAYTMGLPRFFWTFGATHPSARYVIDQRAENAL